MLLFWTVVHILAHYLNIYNFSDSWARIYWLLNLFYTHWERLPLFDGFFWLFYTRERKTINESILKERSLLTEVLSSNPSFGLNPLETKSHNLILATVTLKAGYTGLILVLERAQDFKFESFHCLEIEKMACFEIRKGPF